MEGRRLRPEPEEHCMPRPITDRDWGALQGAIAGEVVLPGSPGYELARKPPIARFQDVRPQEVVRCATPSDVAETISLASPAGLEHGSYRETKRYLAEHGPEEDRPLGHLYSKSEFFRRPLPTEAIAALVAGFQRGRVAGQRAGGRTALAGTVVGPGAPVGVRGRVPELPGPRPGGLGARLLRQQPRAPAARQAALRPGELLPVPAVDQLTAGPPAGGTRRPGVPILPQSAARPPSLPSTHDPSGMVALRRRLAAVGRPLPVHQDRGRRAATGDRGVLPRRHGDAGAVAGRGQARDTAGPARPAPPARGGRAAGDHRPVPPHQHRRAAHRVLADRAADRLAAAVRRAAGAALRRR